MMHDRTAGGEPPAVRRAEIDPDVVELVVIAVPDLTRVTHVAQALASLVAGDQIRVLDLVAVVTTLDGAHTAVEPEAVAGLSILRDVEGEVGGFLSDDDIALASAALPPGTTALVLVVEDRWAQVLAGAARASGGRVVGGERIARQRIEESLAAVQGARVQEAGVQEAGVQEAGVQEAAVPAPGGAPALPPTATEGSPRATRPEGGAA